MKNNIKILVFNIWGEFGHFKKFYTTSSPLTFSVPPPTAVFGMLGAILGFGKDEYLNYINANTTKIGIQILNPIKKIRMSINLIDTKNSGSFHLIKNRTQIKTEFLKNPAYRIYVHHYDEKIFNKLIDHIKNKKTHYTVSLGLANLIANFEFQGVYEAAALESATEVITTIPEEYVESIEISEGKRYFKEKMPVNMNPDRKPTAYKDIIMETQGKTLNGTFKNCYRVNNQTIALI